MGDPVADAILRGLRQSPDGLVLAEAGREMLGGSVLGPCHVHLNPTQSIRLCHGSVESSGSVITHLPLKIKQGRALSDSALLEM